MARLQACLQELFAERANAGHQQHRSQTQARLLTGLELLWKLEEQVILPALSDTVAGRSDAAPGCGAAAIALREVGLMRDLAMLAMQTQTANREASMAVLEGLASLHLARLDDLLAHDGAAAAHTGGTSPHLQREIGCWHGQTSSDLPCAPSGTPLPPVGRNWEAEDRDPVGLVW